MPSDPFIDPFAENPADSKKSSKKGGKGKGGAGAAGAAGAKGLKNFGETAPMKLDNPGETGAHTLENFGDTGEIRHLENMGETGAHALEEGEGPHAARQLENFGETGETRLEETDQTDQPRLKNMGDTGPMRLENFGDTGETRLETYADTSKTKLENFGETGENRLENFGDTGETRLESFGDTGAVRELQNFGDTGETRGLQNFGETGETRGLKNMGETGAVDDPFAPKGGRFGDDDPFSGSATAAEDQTKDESQGGLPHGGESTLEEPPSHAALRGADEENTYVVVGDQPEPDSRAAFMNDSASDTASASRGSASGPRSADEESNPTVDLPQDALANLSRPGFADAPENMQKGGSESLTMGGRSDADEDADKTSDLEAEDLRAAGASPLDTESTADQTGPEGAEGETGDATADATGDEPHSSDEPEPDFLYGERFSERYQIPEAPVQASKGPRTFAILAVLLLLGVGGGAYWKLYVDVEGDPVGVSTGGTTRTSSSASTIRSSTSTSTSASSFVLVPPRIGSSTSTSSSATNASTPAGTSSSSSVRVNDEPPPLPPPADAIDAKLRRALGFGLPIERKVPTSGASPGAGPGPGRGN